MGKIQSYQQGDLASSAVGTPGVDNSLTSVLNQVGQMAGAAENHVAALASQEYQQTRVEALRRQAEQRALEKQQRELLDKVDIDTHAAQLDLQLGALKTQTKTEHLKDPDSAVGRYTEQASKLTDDYLKNVPASLQSQVRIKAVESTRSASSDINNWSYTQRTDNARAGLTSTLADYINGAANLGSIEDVGKQWQKVDALKPSLETAYGTDAEKIIRETKTNITKQYVSNLMVKDASLVEPLIKSGAFDRELDGSTRADLIHRADVYVKAKERDDKHQIDLANTQERIVTTKDYAFLDKSDLGAVTAFNNKAKADLEAAVKTGNSELVAKRAQVYEDSKKTLENWGKEQSQKEREQLQSIHNSPKAKEIRDAIVERRATKLPFIVDSVKAEKALRAQQAAVEAAYKANYLTEAEHRVELNWLSGKIQANMKTQNKRGGLGRALDSGVEATGRVIRDLGEQINATWMGTKDRMGAAAYTEFGKVPAAPGKTQKDTHRQLINSYTDLMDVGSERYKRAHGKDPDAAALRTIDIMAKTEARRRLYGQ